VTDPLAPLTVRVNVPRLVRFVVLIVSVDVPGVATELGTNVAVE
jgi:hypothetical protein